MDVGVPDQQNRPPRRRVFAAALVVLVVVAAIVMAARSSGTDVTGDALGAEGAATGAHAGDGASPSSATPGSPPPTVSGDNAPGSTSGTSEVPAPAPTDSTAPTVPPTVPAPATTAPAPPRPTVPPTTVAPAPAGRSVDAFRGLGVWMDVLDWSPTYTNGAARARLADIDTSAANGAQTLYIQTARFNRPEDVLDEGLLRQFIARVHSKGMKVVAWYLPTHQDAGVDLRRLVAAANLPVDAVGVDIESTAEADLARRNDHLVQLSRDLRAATPKPLGAIVIPPVVTQVLNTNYWPQFPWAALSPLYDVWMPMGYWSNRTAESGWRDGYRYTASNIDLLRQSLRNPNAVVHAVGGIADDVTPADVDGMARAIGERGAIGGSLYDYVTTGSGLWPNLVALRR